MKKLVSIWMQPIYARLNTDGVKTLLVILALFPVLSQVITLILEWQKGDGFHPMAFLIAFGLGMAVVSVIVFYVWFVMLIQNMGLQYSPANARLVPRLKFWMQLAIVIPIVFFAVTAGLVAWIVRHQFSMLPSFVCVLVTVFFMLIMRSQWAVLAMIICFQVPTIFVRAGLDDVDEQIERMVGVPFDFILLVASLLILIVSVRWVFSVKDENLFQMHKRTVRVRLNMSGAKAHESGFMRAFFSAFSTWMDFCVRRALPICASPDAKQSLIIFGLGPRLHWLTITTQLLAMLVWGVVSVFVLTRFSSQPNGDFLRGFGFGFSAVVLISQPLLLGFQLFYSLYQTRLEQALVSLTPAARDGDLQDRILQHYLLRQFFILYGISLLVTAVVCGLVFPFELKSAAIMLFVTSIFPVILVIPRDHAKMRSASDHPLLRVFLGCLAIFAVFFIALLVLPLHLVWGYCAAIFIVTTIVLLKARQARRQSRMFPVGRAV
jgi:hypothetical protein